MKKLSISFLTLIWLSLFGFSTASAGGIGFGVTGSFYNVEASGTETDSQDTTDSSTRTASVDNDVYIASGYLEVSADSGLAIGYEFTPGAADVSDKVQTRTDTEDSVTGTAKETGTSREFKAQAEVENYDVVYLEVPIFGSIYARAGHASIDVNTKETASSNGGSYGNATLDGLNLGVGVKGLFDNNVRWKVAYEQTDFDTLSLTSTGNSVTSETNSITADLDTWSARLSLGYQF